MQVEINPKYKNDDYVWTHNADHKIMRVKVVCALYGYYNDFYGFKELGYKVCTNNSGPRQVFDVFENQVFDTAKEAFDAMVEQLRKDNYYAFED